MIAALLTCPDDAHALTARLEEYYLCNRDAGENLTFGLLADLPEADHAHAPVDPAILRAARTQIEALNARYGGRFYLFTRERTTDARWELVRMGAKARRAAPACAASVRGGGRDALCRRRCGRRCAARHICSRSTPTRA